MNTEKMYEQFLREKEYMLDRSPKTMAYLRQGAKHFMPIIGSAMNEGELRRLTLEAITHVLELPVRARSKNTYLGPLRTFLGWLLEQEIITRPVRIKKVKVERKLRETLTTEQIEKLLAYKCKRTYERRIQAASALMLDTGLRSAEWRNLKLADMDLGKQHLKVYGKGAVERMVPFSAECRKFLMRWIMRLPEGSIYVFPTQSGKAISGRNALRDLTKLAAHCQIWRVNLHMLRHSFATGWIRNGGSVEILRRVLGHTDVRTTMAYMHNSVADMQAAHHQFSPVARMK